MDEVQIYRKQGLAIVTVHLKGEEEFQQSTSDYDILIKCKKSLKPEWFTLKFSIPKRVIRETDLSKIEDLVFEIDCKNYTAKVRFNPKYIYIREKAKSDARISTYYRNKRRREEAKSKL